MTNKISASALRERLRYDPETGDLYWLPRQGEAFAAWNKRFASKRAFATVSQNGYLVGDIDGKQLRANRVIWAIVFDEWPPFIGHENGNRADNRLLNLKSVSRIENNRNQKLHATNVSGCSGVHWDTGKSKWVARIYDNGKWHRLGSFADKQAAVSARKLEEARLGYHRNHGKVAEERT